jgi:hypothetical protein
MKRDSHIGVELNVGAALRSGEGCEEERIAGRDTGSHIEEERKESPVGTPAPTLKKRGKNRR